MLHPFHTMFLGGAHTHEDIRETLQVVGMNNEIRTQICDKSSQRMHVGVRILTQVTKKAFAAVHAMLKRDHTKDDAMSSSRL